MASNTHEDGQIVGTKEITPVSSSPKKYDFAESSSSRSALSKNEEQMKSFVQPDDDNVKNKEVVAENLSSVPENNNELFHIEGEEMNICDTCGDRGCESLLAICNRCGVGAEHTYCMAVKVEEVPQNWSCYECIKDEDGMRQREENEEAGSRKRPFIDFSEVAECSSSQRRPDLNAQKSSETIGLDLNIDPNLDLNVDPNLDLNQDPNIDLNVDPNLDLNLDPNLDMNRGLNLDLNLDPNLDLNLDPNLDQNLGLNLDLTLDCASSYRSRSSSLVLQGRTRMSPNP